VEASLTEMETGVPEPSLKRGAEGREATSLFTGMGIKIFSTLEIEA